MWRGPRTNSFHPPRGFRRLVLSWLSGWCRPESRHMPRLRNVPGGQEARSDLLRADLQDAHGSERKRGFFKYR